MVNVVEVKTSKQKKEFLNFPIEMYKDNPCFVPPLYGDEKKIFRDDYVYYDTCEAVYYNAYRDGNMVGRISGILQKVSNEIRNEKRIRFTRFDSINDQEVANALFNAVEKWGREKGMDTVCGPLGFSDLEREGLLIEGFDEGDNVGCLTSIRYFDGAFSPSFTNLDHIVVVVGIHRVCYIS